VTFLPHTRRIYAAAIRMSSDFESIRPLVLRDNASYAIRVPRAGSLPAASFRFLVAQDTLAVRLEVPDIKASIGTFTQQVTSCFAFAPQLSASVKTLRVMPDAQTKKGDLAVALRCGLENQKNVTSFSSSELNCSCRRISF